MGYTSMTAKWVILLFKILVLGILCLYLDRTGGQETERGMGMGKVCEPGLKLGMPEVQQRQQWVILQSLI